MMTKNESAQLLKQLQPLLDKAVQNHQWLYMKSQEIWFSPRQVKETVLMGTFNNVTIDDFTLVNPYDFLKKNIEGMNYYLQIIEHFNTEIQEGFKL